MEKDLHGILAAGEAPARKDSTALQVLLSGRTRPLYTDVRWMFNRLFNTNDFTTTNIGAGTREIKAKELLDGLKELGWFVINEKRYHIIGEEETKPTEVVLYHEDNMLIQCGIEYRSTVENSRKTERELLIYDFPSGEIAYIKVIEVFHRFSSHPLYSEDHLNKIIELAKSNFTETDKGAAIGIISCNDGEYYVKNFSLEGKTPPFTHPDLHYGDGFEDFHKALLNRLDKTTKGLVLLHGEPGTGKTQYIRVLLKELGKINKSILYAPPSLSSSLTDPEMIEFISDWVIEEERDCILLIEDAEPLLEARGSFDGRSTGISNLLNMTDGLLNDILGLTVIATFNINISQIDPALLRPQRLIARKEFKKMDKEHLSKLATALDIELSNIEYPASLADFYSTKDESHILIHDFSGKKRNQIGFRTDE